MAARALKAAAASIAAWKLGAAASLEAEFEEFLAKHGKHYEGGEKEARFEAFRENYAFVEEENAKGLSYRVEMNMFGDMSRSEFGHTKLGLRVPSDQQWGSLLHLGSHEVRNVTLPDEVDWVGAGAVTPVKNQGQCGSCWSFSTTGALEGAWQIASGKLVSLSEQQFIDCSGKFGEEGCNGGLMDSAFKYAEQAPLCSESSYAYEAKDGICKVKTCEVIIPSGSVVGFKDVTKDSTEALQDAVAQQPVSIAIEADKQVFQLYKGGILTAPCGDKLDHGVLLVGYGTDEGAKYWKVKNSWGSSWGEEGYIRLALGKKGPGECGLKSMASYPVLKTQVLSIAESNIINV